MSKTIHLCSLLSTGEAGANNNFYPIYGQLQLDTAETDRSIRQRIAGTFSNLSVRINATGTTRVIRFRAGGVNGNQVVSPGNGLSGNFEDTANTDTPSDGDDLAILLTESGTNPTLFWLGLVFAAASGTATLFGTASTNTIASAITRYSNVSYSAQETTEANAQRLVRSAGTWQELFVHISANATDGTANIRSRINSANGNQLVQVPANTSGFFEDTTNTDSIVSGDLINYSVQTAAGSGNISYRMCSHVAWATSQNDGFGHINVARTASATTHYWSLLGRTSTVTGTTEADAAFPVSFACRFQRLRCFVSAYSLGAAVTLQFRKNSANGNQSVVINGTGTFEDTTNVDDLAIGDTFNLSIAGGTSGSVTVHHASVTMNEIEPSIPAFMASYRRRREGDS